MIAYLKGIIIQKEKNCFVVMTESGVGYEIHVPSSFFLKLKEGQECVSYTYLKVSENNMELFGFETAQEKQFFELLITVSGIGPRTAMNIFGLGSIDEIRQAISRGDVSYLTQVSGMGKKTAERLCVELKNKVGQETWGHGEEAASGKLGEIIEGLMTMGYSREQARAAIVGLDNSLPIEELLRQ